MSCCSGKCGCGDSCKCGSGCNGCSMYPNLSYSEASGAATETIVLGVAPRRTNYGGSEMVMGATESGGCKCGSSCNCDPCTCK